MGNDNFHLEPVKHPTRAHLHTRTHNFIKQSSRQCLAAAALALPGEPAKVNCLLSHRTRQNKGMSWVVLLKEAFQGWKKTIMVLGVYFVKFACFRLGEQVRRDSGQRP